MSNQKRTEKGGQTLFAVVCLDRPGSTNIRSQSLEAHRRYVEEHASIILSSGPLLDDDGVSRCGQLFILNVPDDQHAHAFINADPFTTVGLFEKVIVRQFTPVFNDGIRQRFL
jgi:uncharacterized protein YciI